MPVAQDTFTYWRSRLALLIKHRAPLHEIDEARRNMLVARLRDQIQAALTQTPDLSPVQRQQLARLFSPGDGR